MLCPYCSSLENKVIDSRLSQGGAVTRRRRECEECGKRYTTYERIEQSLPMVIKRNGVRQPFDRQKILAGLKRATIKRPFSADDLDEIIEAVEKSMVDTSKNELPSTWIGNEILSKLKGLDQVAYVRFASVYRDFQNVEEFKHELSELEEK